MGRADARYLVAKGTKRHNCTPIAPPELHPAAVQVLGLGALPTLAAYEGDRCQGHPRRPALRAGFAFRGCSG